MFTSGVPALWGKVEKWSSHQGRGSGICTFLKILVNLLQYSKVDSGSGGERSIPHIIAGDISARCYIIKICMYNIISFLFLLFPFQEFWYSFREGLVSGLMHLFSEWLSNLCELKAQFCIVFLSGATILFRRENPSNFWDYFKSVKNERYVYIF